LKQAERLMTDQEAAITKFLKEHPALKLHPGKTVESFAALVTSSGGCPCVPDRPRCPCDEVLDDIDELNHCRCYMFVNSKYLAQYDEVMKGMKSKRTRKRQR
jgi:hypothetical protein